MIEIVIQNTTTGQLLEIGQLVTKVTWETQLANQPGKLVLECVVDKTLGEIPEGSIVRFSYNSQKVFYGYLFNKTKKPTSEIILTAYDQMRYLKNKDTYVFSQMKASDIFEKICKDYNLTYKILESVAHTIPNRVFDNKTLFDIINTAIEETLVSTGSWFMIRDNFGTLEFVNINSLRTNTVIGDSSLLTDYEFESSIDSDTYNQIKLIQNDKKTSTRKVYIAKDSSTITRWGTLQYFQEMDENLNDAQIQERADKLLSLKNRVTKDLKLSCLGELSIRAGSGVLTAIEDLDTDGFNQLTYSLVTSCTHSFENGSHTMDLQLQRGV